jgi:hypothetical protein
MKSIKVIRGEYTRKHYVSFLLVLTLLLLILPQGARLASGKPTLLPHEHFIQLIIEQQAEPTTLLQQRNVYITPYHTSMSWLHTVLGKGKIYDIMLLTIRILMGVISILVMYTLLKDKKVAHQVNVLAPLLVLISPAFLYTFGTQTSNSMAVCFTLIGILLFTRSRFIFSYLFLGIAGLFSLANAVIILIVLVGYLIMEKKIKNIFPLSILFVVYMGEYVFMQPPWYQAISNTGLDFMQRLVYDLGGVLGISLFVIILACIGVFYRWKKKKTLWPVYGMVFLLLIGVGLVGDEFVVYALIPLAYFAAFGFYQLCWQDWEVKYLKQASVMIILCGLLFSTVSYTSGIVAAEPTTQEIQAVQALADMVDEGTVLSHPHNAFLIESIAKKTVVLDNLQGSFLDQEQKEQDLQKLFQTRSVEDASRLMQKYDIQYVMVTESMRNGKVWHTENEGLLFLLNTNLFKKVYENDDVTLWKVKN